MCADKHTVAGQSLVRSGMGRTYWNMAGDLRQIGSRTKRTRFEVHLAGCGLALAFHPKNYSLFQLITSTGTSTSTSTRDFPLERYLIIKKSLRQSNVCAVH